MWDQLISQIFERFDPDVIFAVIFIVVLLIADGYNARGRRR